MKGSNLSKGRTYFYIVAFFSLGVLAYSLWILYDSYTSYLEGRIGNFYMGLVIAVIGIGLAISSLTTLRKRVGMLQAKETRTITTEFCQKCSYKKIRKFKTGDYVHKRVKKCSQCGGDLIISSIYVEGKDLS